MISIESEFKLLIFKTFLLNWTKSTFTVKIWLNNESLSNSLKEIRTLESSFWTESNALFKTVRILSLVLWTFKLFIRSLKLFEKSCIILFLRIISIYKREVP